MRDTFQWRLTLFRSVSTISLSALLPGEKALMKPQKWLVVAGAVTIVGCDGGTDASRAPATTPQVAARKISSVPNATQHSKWTVYNSEEGGFSVLLPATPKLSTQPGRLFTSHIIKCNDGTAYFILTFFDPPPRSIAPEVVNATLKKDRDLGLQDIQGTLKSEERITIRKDGQDWPGIASVMENSSFVINGREYAVGSRVYTLQVGYMKGQDHEADVRKFFDSFKISETSRPR